jgi:hypothetical protein
MANGRLRFQGLVTECTSLSRLQLAGFPLRAYTKNQAGRYPRASRAGRGEVCWLHVADTKPKRYQSLANLDRLLIQVLLQRQNHGREC